MKLAVGQRVVVEHDVYWERETIARKGDVGKIVALGVDARYGYGVVAFGAVRVPLSIGPVAHDAAVSVISDAGPRP